MIRSAFRGLSPGGERGRLWILIFHRVQARPDPLFPEEMHAERFDTMCGWLRRWCHVLPLDEAARRLQDRSLPPAAAAITFDDGYADNHDVALPILQRHGLPATFFIATGFLDGGCMWNDVVIEAVRNCASDAVELDHGLPGRHPAADTAQRRSLIDQLLPAIKHLPPDARLAAAHHVASRCRVQAPPSPMLTTAQLRGLAAAGMQIGAHTVDHPVLVSIDDSLAAQEIARSRHDLEQSLHLPVTLFAYPNGRPMLDYDGRHVDMVRRAGFEAAVSTAQGVCSTGTNPYELPRFTPWGRSPGAFALRAARMHLARQGLVPSSVGSAHADIAPQ